VTLAGKSPHEGKQAMTMNKPQSIPPGMERPAALPTSAPSPENLSRNPWYDRDLAEKLVNAINQQIRKWEAWYPDPESEVAVARNELLAMKRFAEIGLNAGAPPIPDAMPENP